MTRALLMMPSQPLCIVVCIKSKIQLISTSLDNSRLIQRSANNSLNVNKHTTQNLDLIREATNNLEGTRPSDSRILLAISKNCHDLSINIHSFLWKLIHNTHKCRQYWLKIKTMHEDHGICQNCNMIESMQHIIFNCEANGCDHACLEHSQRPML